MKKGKLIVLEGACDGIGKTTQYNLLIKRLSKDNEVVVSHHFPSYNTYQGEPVTRYLSGEYGKLEDLSPYFINSLYANDRAITWNTKLKKLSGRTNYNHENFTFNPTIIINWCLKFVFLNIKAYFRILIHITH